MENIGTYALKITTHLEFEKAIEKVTELLAAEKFGILTEIDVKATFKNKLDVDFKPYRILGACNPPFAHKVLSEENLMGVLLPCNVVVWDEGDYRVVAAMNPQIMGSIIDNPAIQEVADEVAAKMSGVLEKLENI